MLGNHPPSLSSDPRVNLERFERLFETLEAELEDDGSRFVRLESMRMGLMATLDSLLLPLSEPSFPLRQDDLRLTQRGLGVLEQLRDQYLKVQEARKPTRVQGRRLMPSEAADSLDQVLPLMRALDAQSRLIRIMLRKRLDVPGDYWRELVTLGARARASTFIDVALDDPAPLLKGDSARGLLILPLLLRAAGLGMHPDDDRVIIDRLARQSAARVGFRIDVGGEPFSNPHGPTLSIDDRLSIRLDTHRLQKRLAQKDEDLKHGVAYGQRLPRGMTQESMRRLLARLVVCWSSAMQAPRVHPIDPTQCAVHFGIPGSIGDAPVPEVGYDDGQYEFNTLMRVVRQRKADRSGSVARGALPLWLSQAPPVICQAWSPADGLIQAVFARNDATTIHHHSLVVVRPDPRYSAMQIALADRAMLWLGRLVGMTQRMDEATGESLGQQLSVQLWPRPGRMVGLRFSIEGPFEDILYLTGAAGDLDEHSVLLPPGRVTSKAALTLRLPDRDVAVRFGNLIERGHQFERVRLLLEND